MRSFKQNIVRVLVVCVCCMGLPVPSAHAELVSTDQVQSLQGVQGTARQRMDRLFDRSDVRAVLEDNGVSVEQAKARVEALSDDEVETLTARLDSLPAGGNGFEVLLVVGFLTFVILLITDILGFTKVFSFTRPAK